jgi:cytochrome c oxidase subunit 1
VAVGSVTAARWTLWLGLAFLAVGGALAVVMRAQLAWPGVVAPAGYTTLFTSHGVIMIFFAVAPIVTNALATYAIPRAIGAKDLAFPWVTAASFAALAAGQGVMLASLVVKLAPTAAWTMYAPLSSAEHTPGVGQTLAVIAVGLAALSSTLTGVNHIVTVLRRRSPDVPMAAAPLVVWGSLLAAVLNVLFAPVLVAASGLVLAGRLGAAPPLDPILYQNLFWIFGHPEVYILILPVWGIVGDVVARGASRQPFWKQGTVAAMIGVTVLSGVVYGHHMFTTGLQPVVGTVFEGLTLAISVPSCVIFANWLHTLWRARVRYTAAMLFSLGVVVVFGAGGLTGILLGAIATNIALHDSMFVVGHFHLIMAAAVMFGAFAGVYEWHEGVFGRPLSPRLGVAHFALTVPPLAVAFALMLVVGWRGQLRRLADPYQHSFLAGTHRLNHAITGLVLVAAAGQLLFVVTWLRARRA